MALNQEELFNELIESLKEVGIQAGESAQTLSRLFAAAGVVAQQTFEYTAIQSIIVPPVHQHCRSEIDPITSSHQADAFAYVLHAKAVEKKYNKKYNRLEIGMRKI